MKELKPLPESAKAKHLKLLKTRFDNTSPKNKLSGTAGYPKYIDALFDYLRTNLEKILTGKPSELIRVIKDIEADFNDFHAQAQRKRTSKDWQNHPEDANAISLVENCFNYKEFGKKTKSWGAYALVDAIGIRICPYCQLHHVNYHMPEDTNADFSLRPPLDHYFPKTNYPYLAVSLNNLFPCCSQCNSSIKLALDPLALGLRHPRLGRQQMTFSAKGSVPISTGGTHNDVRISIHSHDAESTAHVEAFKLKQRYEWYSREIYDLMQNFNRFSEYSKSVKDALWQDEFVLGFPPKDAEDRALGLCLLDVFKELQLGKVV